MEHAGFISSPEIAAQNSGRMDEPRAVRDRLCHGGWDEVALAGVTDLPWDRILEILAPVVGRLSFGEELELRAVLSRGLLCNRTLAIGPLRLKRRRFLWMKPGTAAMDGMPRHRWHH